MLGEKGEGREREREGRGVYPEAAFNLLMLPSFGSLGSCAVRFRSVAGRSIFAGALSAVHELEAEGFFFFFFRVGEGGMEKVYIQCGHL